MEISVPSIKINLVTIFIIGFLFWIMSAHLLCSCTTVSPGEVSTLFRSTFAKITESFMNKEGYQNYKDTQFAKANMEPVDTKAWFSTNLSYNKNQDISKNTGIQSILNRPPQPIPLPEGELDFFATTQFKPECCPNAYSNSTGCACMTVDQYNYLIDRGSNNVPYSEY